VSLMSRNIQLKTEVPGPKSRAVLARLKEAVPRAAAVFAPVVVERAHGALLTDIDGNTFIDLTGGVGVLNVGHTNDRVVEAVQAQVPKFLHTDFTMIPYENYVRLAERLNARFPGGAKAKTIFFNSGAEAVENAVKIAKMYTGRRAVIAFEGAFHGRTLMAMSLTSKPKPYKAGLGPFAAEVYRAPYPNPYHCPRGTCGEDCFRAVEHLFDTHVAPEEVAAIVVEPVQGEGGFVVPPEGFLGYLRQLCDRHGIVLVVDEVQTGFGRTGAFFATEHSGITPDLITVAKSIADGLPLSGVIGKAEIMDAAGESTIGGTYVGNPVACAAANAVLDVFEQEDLLGAARRQGEYLLGRMRALADRCPAVGDVRGLGAMVAMEFVRDRTTKEPDPELTERILHRTIEHGVILLKAGIYNNVIRFLAPLNTPQAILAEAFDVLEQAVLEEAR
jgi:4-aminobutyrate aminotransferase/(S)-3-amino-2-methylpropionate transaminase